MADVCQNSVAVTIGHIHTGLVCLRLNARDTPVIIDCHLQFIDCLPLTILMTKRTPTLTQVLLVMFPFTPPFGW